MRGLPAALRSDGNLSVELPNGRRVTLPIARPSFHIVKPRRDEFTFGNKPIAKYRGERLFVELCILREFEAAGWAGRWASAFGKHFLSTQPHKPLRNWHHPLPPDRRDIFEAVQQTADTRASFDVVAWRGKRTVFVESKQPGERLTNGQRKWVCGALKHHVDLLIVEWTRYEG